MLASLLSSTRLAVIAGKLAAVRAGSVSSVVHRGAFLFKIQGACPSTQRDSQATANFAGRARGVPVRSSLRKKRTNANQIVHLLDLSGDFQGTQFHGFHN
ncbi:hypothetical protein [Cupriavidus necator]|uniref:hypothetical protein n=1 Tax=Cupriavidus necator TaxID=106590 RepID=UPI0012D2C7D7|nr:hypothetical protein [Cupriavidus necator]